MGPLLTGGEKRMGGVPEEKVEPGQLPQRQECTSTVNCGIFNGGWTE